jgi:hypothetical protein
MSIAGRWFITPHAVRQFQVRCGRRPSPSYEEALAELIRLSETARPISGKVGRAYVEYRGARPNRHLRFRVIPAPQYGPDAYTDNGHRLAILLTVLSSVVRQ